MQTPSQALRSEQGPDWETVADDVTCPLCEYNLRGLKSSRCPECGYAFEWRDVLDPHRRKHPYLFEHHPEASFTSFFETILGGMTPSRFWKTLHPVQPPRRLRLMVYAMVIALVAAAPLLLGVLLGLPGGNAYELATYSTLPWKPWESAWGYLVHDFFRREVGDHLIQVSLYILAIPIVTTLALLVFQASLRRTKLGFHHVARCVIYSADAALVPGVAVAALVAINSTPHFAEQLILPIGWGIVGMLPLLWLVFAWRLVQAYRHYLRFPHAVATVASTQIIVLLVLAIGEMFLEIRW